MAHKQHLTARVRVTAKKEFIISFLGQDRNAMENVFDDSLAPRARCQWPVRDVLELERLL